MRPELRSGRSRRLWLNGLAIVLVVGTLATVSVVSGRNSPGGVVTAGRVVPKSSPAAIRSTSDLARYKAMTVSDLATLPEDELETIDPLVVNMIVAKELPELTDIDFGKYVRIVDGWAERISSGLAAAEANGATDPSYEVDPNIWRAGGMAIAVAGRSIGIMYTRDVTLTDHADLFVPGMIETKEGTCSNMPMLHLAIGWRLGWPLKAVVTRDHMWCRWDDGVPGPDDGGSYFNLEATAASNEGGGWGGFSTPTDEQYIKDFQTPLKAIESGSDMVSLTARQTLGVLLQQRAGYWRAQGKPYQAFADMQLAAECFPQNVDIQSTLAKDRNRLYAAP